MNRILEKYIEPSNPGSYSGIYGFLKNNKKFNKKQVEKTLRAFPPYTLHKSKRLKYKRLRVEVGGIDSEWQIDLIETQDISGSNFGTRYIFTCIDVFSKKSWAVSLKNKEAASCLAAFKKIIFDSNRRPNYIYIDNGKKYF